MSEYFKRMVFVDEAHGKVECHSEGCKWTGNDDCLYNHYKENHCDELMTSEDNTLTWKYMAQSGDETRTFLAWISDTMFWIHTKIEDQIYHVVLKYAVCGNFIYNIRVVSEEKIGIGLTDKYEVLSKNIKPAGYFEKEHFTMKVQILDNMCQEATDPKFLLTLSEDEEVNNAVAEFCRMYLEDDSYKYECLTNVPYEFVTFAEDDFKCGVCSDDNVHASQLTLCDEGHSICLKCKSTVTICPVRSCNSAYSSDYKNPAIEKALKLFGWQGLPYE